MRNTDFVVTLFEGKANPNNLTVAVVMGVNAIQQGHSATIILMVEAVEMGQPGAAKGIDIGAPFPEVGGHLEAAFPETGSRWRCWRAMDCRSPFGAGASLEGWRNNG